MLSRLVLLTALGLVMTGARPAATRDVGPDLAEVRHFSQTEGDSVWPGYGRAPFGFLLVTESQESLLCRDAVPQGFEPAGRDSHGEPQLAATAQRLGEGQEGEAARIARELVAPTPHVVRHSRPPAAAAPRTSSP
jgi:hypothetical protein